MVAKITVPLSIKRALNYNEQKVQQGVAVCIYAHNFLKEAEQLNFYEKLHRFEHLIALNKRASTNTVHISLNFGLNENLKKQKLIEIASTYMEKIGFGGQPYLVYQHYDAGHFHIHVVTTNIQKNGRRISLHNIGKNQSNTARKEIEILYGLQKAEEQNIKKREELKPLNAQRVTYGKAPTRQAITNVLDAVLPKYKYASLAELNAVLRLYNITADRGKEGGVIFKNRGLVYRVLDEKGNKIGVPIKASAIYNKPTLDYLEKRFKENEIAKQQYKKQLKTSIDWIMVKLPKSLFAFKQELEKEKVALVVRQNTQGIIYGLTYIDYRTKCVFNGSDIGKEYSAKGILEKCGLSPFISKTENSIYQNISNTDKPGSQDLQEQQKRNSKVLNVLLTPTEQYNYVPYELRKPKKKKNKSL